MYNLRMEYAFLAHAITIPLCLGRSPRNVLMGFKLIKIKYKTGLYFVVTLVVYENSFG